MSLSARLALCLALSCNAGIASAQTLVVQGGNRDGVARPFGLRVQTQMQISLPAANLHDLNEQKAQQEIARRALYDMANRECRTLREVFGGECRLVSLNVNSNVQDRRPSGPEMVVTSGSASFDINAEPGSRP